MGRPVYLLYLMSAQLVDYTSDVADHAEPPDTALLYARFITWVRRATMTARAA